MRERLRQIPLWVDLRRWQRDGIVRSYRRWRLYSQILKSPPVATDAHWGETELHLLCYRGDYLGAIWTLKTFYLFSQSSIPLVIHTQGEATRRMNADLKRHFPNARIISQAEADATVVPQLRQRGFHRLLAARSENHYILKLTDFLLLGNAPHLLTLDSDVLFFQNPEEFTGMTSRHLFQRDPESNYVISETAASKAFGIELTPRINVGMMHFRRENVSLARCDEYLSVFANMSGWLEQTLYALHASESGNAEFLPESYLISLSAGIDHSKLVARHYAGPSRSLLHEEGIPFLLRERPDIRNPQRRETR